MSLIVSGVATARAVEASSDFGGFWVQSSVASWVIAFPTIVAVAPLVTRLVGALTER
jgi:hypothetical protein